MNGLRERTGGEVRGSEESTAIIHALVLIDTSFRMPRPDYLLEVNGALQSNLFVGREREGEVGEGEGGQGREKERECVKEWFSSEFILSCVSFCLWSRW